MIMVEHAFSIVMSSRDQVKNVKVSDDRNDCVVFEGALGELMSIEVVDGVMLEINGRDGVLRMDMPLEEISRAVKAAKKKR
jgi:hypothetical protein